MAPAVCRVGKNHIGKARPACPFFLRKARVGGACRVQGRQESYREGATRPFEEGATGLPFFKEGAGGWCLPSAG